LVDTLYAAVHVIPFVFTTTIVDRRATVNLTDTNRVETLNNYQSIHIGKRYWMERAYHVPRAAQLLITTYSRVEQFRRKTWPSSSFLYIPNMWMQPAFSIHKPRWITTYIEIHQNKKNTDSCAMVRKRYKK
jgi:hypothetical protein